LYIIEGFYWPLFTSPKEVSDLPKSLVLRIVLGVMLPISLVIIISCLMYMYVSMGGIIVLLLLNSCCYIFLTMYLRYRAVLKLNAVGYRVTKNRLGEWNITKPGYSITGMTPHEALQSAEIRRELEEREVARFQRELEEYGAA